MATAQTPQQREERLLTLKHERARLKDTVPETQSHGIWMQSMLEKVEKEILEYEEAEEPSKAGGCLCLPRASGK